MTTMTVTEARKTLYNLVDETNISHQPVHILGKRGGAVLIGEDDWNAIEETLYLNQFPGLVKSIKDAAKEPLDNGTLLEDLNW